MNAKSFSYLAQWLVFRPEKGWKVNENGGDQFGVDQADAKTVQATRLDHDPHFVQPRHFHLGQEVEQCKRPGTVTQGT